MFAVAGSIRASLASSKRASAPNRLARLGTGLHGYGFGVLAVWGTAGRCGVGIRDGNGFWLWNCRLKAELRTKAKLRTTRQAIASTGACASVNTRNERGISKDALSHFWNLGFMRRRRSRGHQRERARVAAGQRWSVQSAVQKIASQLLFGTDVTTTVFAHGALWLTAKIGILVPSPKARKDSRRKCLV